MKKSGLINLINKFGLKKTSKFVDIKTHDLVKYTNYVIEEPDEANLVLSDLLYTGIIPQRYKNFDIYLNVDKRFLWKMEQNIMISEFDYGFYEKLSGICKPFMDDWKIGCLSNNYYLESFNEPDNLYFNYSGFYVKVIENNVKKFENIDDLIDWYIKIYLPNSYEAMMGFLKTYRNLTRLNFD